MKMIYGLIFAMLSTAVIAQPPLPPAPGGATATPEATTSVLPPPVPPDAAPKTPKKKVVKKKTTAPKTAAATPAAAAAAPISELATNEPAVVKVKSATVRGQAHINSEIVGHLKKDDTVTVLEIVTLKHPGVDEPAKWARIALPADMHAWANSSFIDASNQTVSARKLNLRTGPGENYSIIGRLQKGDAVKTITNKGSWTQIEPPTNSFAFVAAHLLVHKEAAPVLPPPIVESTPPPVPTVVENHQTIAGPATGNPGAPMTTPPIAPPIVSLPPIAPRLAAVEQPLPKRVVEREGLVGGAVSIQAPSHFELKNLDDGNVMDYLYTTSTNLTLKRYKGMTVLVSGEEELDERWPNTPVLTIQKIQVVK